MLNHCKAIAFFWLLLMGAAFGKFVQPPENAYRDFFSEIAVLHDGNDLKTSINARENWFCNYDDVQDMSVYTYVRQNPWSKFDPLGLHEVLGDDRVEVKVDMNLDNPVIGGTINLGGGHKRALMDLEIGQLNAEITGNADQYGKALESMYRRFGHTGMVGRFVRDTNQRIADPETYDRNSAILELWTLWGVNSMHRGMAPSPSSNPKPRIKTKGGMVPKSQKEIQEGGRGEGFPDQKVEGPPVAKVRTSNRPGNKKAVELTYPDGVVKDISSDRVKGSVPNTHPKAPSGSKSAIKFDKPIKKPKIQPHKRKPTQDELEILNNATGG